jgi:hypothetical protein
MRDVNNGFQSPYIEILLLVNLTFFILQSSSLRGVVTGVKNLLVSESNLKDSSKTPSIDKEFKLNP